MPAAWTTPRTWTAGELVTAAIGNSAWRDNLMYLKDSPTFDGSVTVTGTTLLTGVATLTAAPVFSSATASQAVFTNGSKALVSNAITGTGNVVMSASPTLTGTIAGAAMTLSSTLGVTGATTLSSTVATGALTVTGAATVSTTLGVTGATTLSSTVATGALTVTGAATVSSTLGVTGAVTGGTYNGQTISSAASLTGTLGVTGLLTVSGFGTSSFSAGGTGFNILSLKNTTSGASNGSYLELNAGTQNAYIMAFSQGYTSSAPNFASALKVVSEGSGGMDIVSSHASGAIKFYSGGTTQRMALSSAGLLSVSGFGTHSFSASGTGFNTLDIRNTTSGAANAAYLQMVGGTTNVNLTAYSQGYTTAGFSLQSGGALVSEGAGGLSIVAQNASGAIRFYAGGSTLAMEINSARQIVAQVGFIMSSWPTTASAANTRVDNNNFVQLVTSLRANKHDIHSISYDDAHRTIMGLHGVTYRSRVDQDQRVWAGFIADEAEQVNPVLASYDDKGKLESFTYDRVPAYLVPVVQQHDAELSKLAARIAALETKDN